MGVLRGRGGLHSLGPQLARREVLVLHGRRWSVGEALLLVEVEGGLLRWSLGAREGKSGAGRVTFLGDRGHWVGSRAVHLGVRDCARVNETRGIVHAVLGGLEIHGARRPFTAGGDGGKSE